MAAPMGRMGQKPPPPTFEILKICPSIISAPMILFVATNRLITESCFLMFIDKRLNMLVKWRIYNFSKFSSKVKNNKKFT